MNPALPSIRLRITLCTAAVSGLMAVSAWSNFSGTGADMSVSTPLFFGLAVSFVMLLVTVHSAVFSLAQSLAWAWCLVFMGLAPAYQLGEHHWPWLGNFEDGLVARAAWLSVAGMVSLAVMSWRRSLRGTPGAQGPPSPQALKVTHLWLRRLQYLQLLMTAAFVAIIGVRALTGGREAFKDALAQAQLIPGVATSFFLSTSLGIVVPAAAIYLHRQHAVGSRALLWATVLAGFAATNPLVGSRFLTGSYLVSVIGAWLVGRPSQRLLPLGAVVALPTLFPSLDLWRGGGLSSAGLQVAWPRTTLTTGDFDAFEMLVRAVAMVEQSPTPAPAPGAQALGALFYWVPGLSEVFRTDPSGTIVARATGMGFTNVSMPLVGEGYLVAGTLGTVAAMALLGLWLRWLRGAQVPGAFRFGGAADSATGGLLFIVLRGSLISTLDFILAAAVVGYLLRRRRVGARTRPGPTRRREQHAPHA